MSISKHIKEHAMLGVGLGNNTLTIGLGGEVADLAGAVSAYGDRITQRDAATSVTTTLTNGSPTVTFVGTAYFSTPLPTKPRIDDLIKFRDDTRYYKILSIDSNTQITLYEDYAGTTASGVSMDHAWYYLDWVTLLLLPGQHNSDGIDLPSGYVLTGFGQNSNTLSELTVSKGSPFNSVGEVVFKDLTIGPTTAWGSLDAVTRQNQSLSGDEIYWAGQNLLFDSCFLNTRSLDGSHMEGTVSYPFMPNGKTVYKNCRMQNDNSAKWIDIYDAGGSPTYAYSTDTTLISMIGCEYEFLWGMGWNKITNKHGLDISNTATYLFKDCIIDSVVDIPFVSVFPSLVGGIYVSAAAVVDFTNTRIRNSIPSASQPSHGIYVNAAATVNIDNADIEVNDDGVLTSNAGATVNVRGGRVKGGTNALNSSSGTINYDNNVTLIGGTTGAGVANTPT